MKTQIYTKFIQGDYLHLLFPLQTTDNKGGIQTGFVC